MGSGRVRGVVDAAGVLVCEVVLLAFFVRTRGLLGSVDLAHFLSWVQRSSPERALTALVRLLGICVSSGLLVSTVTYGAGALTGRRLLVERSRHLTPALVRRIMDTLAAASVAASSIGSSAAMAGASSPAHVVSLASPADEEVGARTASVPMVTSSTAARVSSTAMGRHFPHPGEIPHSLPATPAGWPADHDAASPGNDFAGLPAGTKVIVVRPGDCLSVLAERHLGDWRLDTEIEALNYGRVQADGRALVDDHWIYPGWALVVPDDAVGATIVGAGTGTGTGTGTAVTEPPARVPEPSVPPVPSAVIVPGRADHKGTPAPAPGAVNRRRPAPAPAPPSPAPGPVRRGPVRPPLAPPGTVAHTSARARAGGDTPAKDSGGKDSGTKDSGTRGSAGSGTKDSGGKGHEAVGAALAIGTIAAAGALWRLDGLRRELSHDRPRGWTIARNRAQVEAAECRSRAIADDESMRWVDLGVRYLSGLIEQFSSESHENIPCLVRVTVGPGGLEVCLAPRPEGRLGWFTPTADGAALVLDPDLAIEDLELLAAGHWPAWPALVSLGESDGATVLVNLEYAGSLAVEGDGRAVRATLGAILLQLVSQPWSAEMLAALYTVGEQALDDRLGPVQPVTPDEAMELAEKLDQIADAREELAGGLSLGALRAIACEALPHVVVSWPGTSDGAARCLAEAARPQSSGVVLVGPGPSPVPAGDCCWAPAPGRCKATSTVTRFRGS